MSSVTKTLINFCYIDKRYICGTYYPKILVACRGVQAQDDSRSLVEEACVDDSIKSLRFKNRSAAVG